MLWPGGKISSFLCENTAWSETELFFWEGGREKTDEGLFVFQLYQTLNLAVPLQGTTKHPSGLVSKLTRETFDRCLLAS